MRDMHTITLIVQMGATGRTTIAINHSVTAEHTGFEAVLLDLDPQASSVVWSDQRENAHPAVVAVSVSRVGNALEASRSRGTQLAVIDTALRTEDSALSAARSTDLSLELFRLTVFGLCALRKAADICTLARVRVSQHRMRLRHVGPWRAKRRRQSNRPVVSSPRVGSGECGIPPATADSTARMGRIR